MADTRRLGNRRLNELDRRLNNGDRDKYTKEFQSGLTEPYQWDSTFGREYQRALHILLRKKYSKRTTGGRDE